MTDSVFNTEEPNTKRQKRIQISCTPPQPNFDQATIYEGPGQKSPDYALNAL